MPAGSRSTVCFLVSLNAHIWLVVLLSLKFLSPPPEYREITLLRLPPPEPQPAGAAEAVEVPEPQVRSEQAPRRPSLSQPSPATADLRKIPQPAQAQKRPQPRVSMKITARPPEPFKQPIERPTPPAPAASPEMPARTFPARPESPRLKLSRQALFEPAAQKTECRDRLSAAAALPDQVHPSAGPAVAAATQLPVLSPAELVPEPDRDQAFDDLHHRGGELRPILEIIQARIDAVTPLVHRTAGACRLRQGVAWVRFRMDRHGYRQEHRVTRSSGSRCLDEQIEEILHLAEPFPYLAGWVPVQVRFRY